MKQPPHIVTLDLSAIGATSLWELRDTLAAEFEANKGARNQWEENAAMAAGVALARLDAHLTARGLRRPAMPFQALRLALANLLPFAGGIEGHGVAPFVPDESSPRNLAILAAHEALKRYPAT